MIIMSMGLQLLPLLSNSPFSFALHQIPPMLPFLLISLLIPSCFGEEEAVPKNGSFLFNGFHGANLSLNGVATIEPGGLLLLTNYTKQTIGHAFFPSPFNFVDSSTGRPLSFSTNFVFAIVPQYPDVGPQGLSFALSPSKELIGSHPSHYLGLFNLTNNGSDKNFANQAITTRAELSQSNIKLPADTTRVQGRQRNKPHWLKDYA